MRSSSPTPLARLPLYLRRQTHLLFSVCSVGTILFAAFRVPSRLSRAISVFDYRLSTGSPRISPPPTFRNRMSSVPQPADFLCIRHVGNFHDLATTRTPLRTGSTHHGLARCHAPAFLPER